MMLVKIKPVVADEITKAIFDQKEHLHACRDGPDMNNWLQERGARMGRLSMQ